MARVVACVLAITAIVAAVFAVVAAVIAHARGIPDAPGALDVVPLLLGDRGIRCELDLWGHDVPHDWPSWRAQLAHHLPRFC